MTHTLWHYRLCPHSRAVRVGLAEAGWTAITLQEERPWEWRASFLALNPAGELPVLQLADGPVIAGAYAISEFVAEEVAAGPRVAIDGAAALDLFPGDREARAEVRRLIDWFLGKMHREVSRGLLTERVYTPLQRGPGYQPDEEIIRPCRANLRQHLSYIGFLAYQRRWLAGDRFSFADVAAVAQLICLDYLGEVPWAEHQAAKDWYLRMKSRPAVRALLAERVPGIPPPIWYTDLDF